MTQKLYKQASTNAANQGSKRPLAAVNKQQPQRTVAFQDAQLQSSPSTTSGSRVAENGAMVPNFTEQ